jgi:hypothetical protein
MSTYLKNIFYTAFLRYDLFSFIILLLLKYCFVGFLE